MPWTKCKISKISIIATYSNMANLTTRSQPHSDRTGNWFVMVSVCFHKDLEYLKADLFLWFHPSHLRPGQMSSLKQGGGSTALHATIQFLVQHHVRCNGLGAKCWWKKSCTTWNVKKNVNNEIFTISTGAGFLPSTVCSAFGLVLWKKGEDARLNDTGAVFKFRYVLCIDIYTYTLCIKRV